jgi:Kef-type K+ transport system membrane component KefB
MYGGPCPHCILEIPGEEAPTDPGLAKRQAAQQAARAEAERAGRTRNVALASLGALLVTGLVVGLALMSLGAWWTDYIHLHAVFGAFVMGSVMPRTVMSRDLIARIQPLAVALLLPLFFTYSGLNTKIGLINTPTLWLVCGVVLLAAVLGKGVACWLAARATGISNREALGIGTLMNARGLMELIIINIGLQKGVITEGLFATLVIMAVITTLTMPAPAPPSTSMVSSSS